MKMGFQLFHHFFTRSQKPGCGCKLRRAAGGLWVDLCVLELFRERWLAEDRTVVGRGGHCFLIAEWDFATSSPLLLNHSTWSNSMKGCRQSMHDLETSSSFPRRSQAVHLPYESSD